VSEALINNRAVAAQLINYCVVHDAVLFGWERWAVENISYRVQQRENISDEEIVVLERIKARFS